MSLPVRHRAGARNCSGGAVLFGPVRVAPGTYADIPPTTLRHPMDRMHLHKLIGMALLALALAWLAERELATQPPSGAPRERLAPDTGWQDAGPRAPATLDESEPQAPKGHRFG